MKIVALPCDRNPYQELLYGPMRRLGATVAYAGEPTRSRTLNQLLLPAELVVRRLFGFRVLHIHWLFGFRLLGADRSRVLLRVSRAWFGFVLLVARGCRYRIVWTVHNVLPHSPVFDDDAAARRTLVGACDLLIAHSEHALDELRALGAHPARAIVIPPGVYDLPGFAALAALPPRPPTTVLCFGQVAEYKGAEDLLAVLPAAGDSLRVVIAGGCSDIELRARLEQRARGLGDRAELLLRFIDEAEVAPLFERAHAAVLPFRAVTTSSSVILAMASARPVIVPALPAFADIPDAAVIRYEPGVDGLGDALARLRDAPSARLADVGRAGREFALSRTWEEVAGTTTAAFSTILAVRQRAPIIAR